MFRAVRLLLVCTLVFVSTTWLGAPGAGAHTEVTRATPGPAAQVDGRVDHVELEFLDPVQPGLVIEVVGDDDTPVVGLGTARLGDDRRVARVRFDSLTVIGTYVVTYEYRALDGARQRGSYSFRFTGGGPDDVAVGLDDPSDSGWVGAVGLVAFAVLAVGAGVMARVRGSDARDDPGETTAAT